MSKELFELTEQYLKDLIRIPSVNPPGAEEAAAKYIAGILKAEGMEPELCHLSEGRANITASFGPDTGREVILNGHLDVVPAGNGWNTDPFEASEKDGRIYGRGACDMKGGIAAMLAAAVTLRRENVPLNGKLTLAFVADEEVNGAGSRCFAEHYPKSGQCYVLIGEPTEMRAATAHLGVARFRVDIQGIQCHASAPQEGLNALTAAANFITAIEKAARQRAMEGNPDWPKLTMTPTMMQAGEKINILPGAASFWLDCRTGPGENAELLKKQLEALFEASAEDSRISCRIETLIDARPGMTPADSPIFTVLDRTAEAVGEKLPRIFMKGSTDMPIFIDNGFADTVILGPGSMECAHTANEYVTIDQLHRAAVFYQTFVKQALL